MLHIVFGDLKFIEIGTVRRKGKVGQRIADETIFGWVVNGDKSKSDHSYFIETTKYDHEKLYTLDVLGVEDRKDFDQEEVKTNFFKNFVQLQRKIPDKDILD